MTEKFAGVRRRTTPEVLAPAGSLETLKTAVDFGADAVYFGGQDFGMRTAPKNFTLEQIEEAKDYAHARGARVFVTCNILPSSSDVEAMNRYMGQLGEIGVDALIVTDIGVLMAARQIAPNTEIHISTQAGVTNYQAANALAQLGASRVVLARELSLDDIRELRANIPADLEVEAFVHGSMCMAFSGRCLISRHTAGRDANQGDCSQPCRYKYHVVEQRRPNEFIPVEITDQGTFLFNSHDMNTLQHVDDILDAGVTSLKIEGRAKSAYYVAAMTNAYKTAVNEYMIQRGFETADGRQLRPFHDRVHIPGDAGGSVRDAVGVPALDRAGEFVPDVARAPVPDVASASAPADTGGLGSAAPPPVRFSPWLAEEPFKVTHREYSTGFYYPERPASEEIKVGGYINEWLLVGVVERYDGPARRLYLHAKNKILPGAEIEFLYPGEPPVPFTVPEQGIFDDAGAPVAEINHPARVFSFPCELAIPAGAMVRARNPRHRPRSRRECS